jgi:hypothetical protein
MRTSLALGVALVLLTTAAWGQNADGSAGRWFRVSWEPSTDGGPATIEGQVFSDSPDRVTNVRLQVEGLDAHGQPVGRTFAWALGDIAPGGETSFVVEPIPGAVTYRIAVVSFDLVSLGPTPGR